MYHQCISFLNKVFDACHLISLNWLKEINLNCKMTLFQYLLCSKLVFNNFLTFLLGITSLHVQFRNMWLLFNHIWCLKFKFFVIISFYLYNYSYKFMSSITRLDKSRFIKTWINLLQKVDPDSLAVNSIIFELPKSHSIAL